MHKAHLRGNYTLDEVGFWYDDEEKLTVLHISQTCKIRAGERVAVLGATAPAKYLTAASGRCRNCSREAFCWMTLP